MTRCSATCLQRREQLRSFELIYRIGGEEFLVVLPGATRAAALALALGEKLLPVDEAGEPARGELPTPATWAV